MTKKPISIKSFVIFAILLALAIGSAVAQLPQDDVQEAARQYIRKQEEVHGAFGLLDPRTATIRHLALVKILEREPNPFQPDLLMAGAALTDVNTGDSVELDFYFRYLGTAFVIEEIRIYKVNEEPRFQRPPPLPTPPLKAPEARQPDEESGGEAAGSPKEATEAPEPEAEPEA
jgi:hypothetical protein